MLNPCNRLGCVVRLCVGLQGGWVGGLIVQTEPGPNHRLPPIPPTRRPPPPCTHPYTHPPTDPHSPPAQDLQLHTSPVWSDCNVGGQLRELKQAWWAPILIYIHICILIYVDILIDINIY